MYKIFRLFVLENNSPLTENIFHLFLSLGKDNHSNFKINPVYMDKKNSSLTDAYECLYDMAVGGEYFFHMNRTKFKQSFLIQAVFWSMTCQNFYRLPMKSLSI